jgi:hypothetical protein
MPDNPKPYCPECEEIIEQPEVLDRRRFIRVVGASAAVLAASGTGLSAVPSLVLPATARANPPAGVNAPRPAEGLIRDLFATMTDDQKGRVVHPWNHGAVGPRGIPTRLRMYNRPISRTIGDTYTAAQRDLLRRILRSICSDEEGYRRISRNNTFDTTGSFNGCGADIFGDPTTDQPFAWVFTGHHLTVRCTGNSEPGAAFGGPMFYGHSPDGYSQRNVFFYQTRSVLSVFDALSERQRALAVVRGTPGEQEPSVRFRPATQAKPGISFGELNLSQRRLVEQVMRDILSPYRKEDVDGVMNIVRQNGGMQGIHLAFYRDARATDNKPWHFWRLEGPGFVWNYRVLPHVHTYVNIARRT